MSLSYLSVCSGIEAATVAWHPLGFRPLAFSEIEPFARAVLTHHYPDVPLHGDFTLLRGEDWIAGADVAAVPRSVCAGFPIKLLNHAALGLPTVIAEGSAQGVAGERVVPNRHARAFARGLEQALAAGDRVDGPAFIARNTWSARAAELDVLYRSLEGA